MHGKLPILIFTNSFQIGGSERQAVEFAKSINRTHFQPYLACFRKDGPLQDELPNYFGEVKTYPLCGFFNATAIRRAFGFLTFLRQSRVQVVQCFDFYTNLFAIPLARMAGVPVILAARREEALTKTAAQRKAERWCYRLATGVVANAEAIREQVVKRDGIRAERVWTVHNGVDLQRFEHPECAGLGRSDSMPKNELTIGVVANLRPEKGHSVFFESARRLSNVYPHVKYLIVGDGHFRRQVEAKVSELGLTKSVCLMGAVKNVPSVLKSMDIAVLPSLTNEGFPNSVMEAMASGLPVVATDTGGTRELVVDGITGYVVPPGDAVALAGRLETLCKDSHMRKKMGELGRHRIEQEFTVDKMARKLETLYLSLLKTS